MAVSLWGAENYSFPVVDLGKAQERFKNVRPEDRLKAVNELGEKIPPLQNLSLDEADALGAALASPSINSAEWGKLLKSYTALGVQRDWVAIKPDRAPRLVDGLAIGAVSGVSAQDFKQLIEVVRDLGREIAAQKAKIAELEAKLQGETKK